MQIYRSTLICMPTQTSMDVRRLAAQRAEAWRWSAGITLAFPNHIALPPLQLLPYLLPSFNLKKQGENHPQSNQTEEGLSLFFEIDRRRQAYLIRNHIFAYKTNTTLPKPSQANSIYRSHKCSSRTRIRTKNFDLHGTAHLFVEAHFYYKTQAKPPGNQAKPTSNQPPP